MRHSAPLAALVLVLLAAPASAGGTYEGASSVAGGRDPVCAGVTQMRAVVSGSEIQLIGAVYEGAGEVGTGTVKSDGSFTAVKPTSKGNVTFSGRVTDHAVTAQWKGPDCYGAIDLQK
ncbi:hypothetical protein [Pinisolibacter aquiterrae]|uniref:hypothetical protein n=1 Tax=Pinisolibacter aquiterrae TaxID=2815579 RepID=UPI001C3CA8FA|nr:hypothetical protein [Pinisolibacter aquiterrae]MBV5262603.1 hypothetical protein [Pinisolibacter aquiterrae]MCC8237055.1 hypothetical protein [Pinisolibacter aquiterrae]